MAVRSTLFFSLRCMRDAMCGRIVTDAAVIRLFSVIFLFFWRNTWYTRTSYLKWCGSEMWRVCRTYGINERRHVSPIRREGAPAKGWLICGRGHAS